MMVWLKVRRDVALIHFAGFIADRLDDEMLAYYASFFAMVESTRRRR